MNKTGPERGFSQIARPNILATAREAVNEQLPQIHRLPPVLPNCVHTYQKGLDENTETDTQITCCSLLEGYPERKSRELWGGAGTKRKHSTLQNRDLMGRI